VHFKAQYPLNNGTKQRGGCKGFQTGESYFHFAIGGMTGFYSNKTYPYGMEIGEMGTIVIE
jgi:hypothetical protein